MYVIPLCAAIVSVLISSVCVSFFFFILFSLWLERTWFFLPVVIFCDCDLFFSSVFLFFCFFSSGQNPAMAKGENDPSETGRHPHPLIIWLDWRSDTHKQIVGVVIRK